jgi:hypothetical protein
MQLKILSTCQFANDWQVKTHEKVSLALHKNRHYFHYMLALITSSKAPFEKYLVVYIVRPWAIDPLVSERQSPNDFVGLLNVYSALMDRSV